MSRYIAYYRVSTKRQGASGLGLDAQRAAVRAHVGGSEIMDEFTEIESGKRNDRPQLARALAAARAHRAILVVAKMDRLARNVEFIAKLLNSGVEFIACDVPSANRLTIHILAAVAEAERDAISTRTRSALAQARAKGVALGGKRDSQRAPTDAERAASLATRQARAAQCAHDLAPVVSELIEAGIVSASGIARALNERGITTSRGKTWQAIQVQRLIRLAGKAIAPSVSPPAAGVNTSQSTHIE